MRKDNWNVKVRKIYDASDELKISNSEYARFVGEFLSFFLKQDEGGGDVTSFLTMGENERIVAKIFAQAEGVLAGIEELKFWLSGLDGDLKVDFLVDDGEKVGPGMEVLSFEGKGREIMLLERTVLNFLQRMSGIATYAAALVKESGGAGGVACTRKTLWGMLDKKAVSVGGGLTHRLNLDDAVLVKDTHLKIIGYDFGRLVKNLMEMEKDVRFVEVEIENANAGFSLVEECVKVGWNKDLVVMLDNFSAEMIGEFLAEFRKKFGGLEFDVFFEASGGIDRKKIRHFLESGVDVVSMGAITMSAPALSFHLKVI